MMNQKTRWTILAAGIVLCLGLLGITLRAQAQSYARTFPETGKTVSGALLEYWITHGGVPLIGYPISDELQEKSPLDGKTYPVQYFQRAELELHPSAQPSAGASGGLAARLAPINQTSQSNQVMASQLGTYELQSKYPTGAPTPK